jgi:hypothetical protein
MLREFWPIFALGAAMYIITRPKVWYWLINLPWRLAWRILLRKDHW